MVVDAGAPEWLLEFAVDLAKDSPTAGGVIIGCWLIARVLDKKADKLIGALIALAKAILESTAAARQLAAPPPPPVSPRMNTGSNRTVGGRTRRSETPPPVG